ncbi:MAG: tetratricopeptide repeat protein [Actinomycetota bacterium]
MDESYLKTLLEDLKNSDETVRDRATTELWRHWFLQKGEYGMQILRRSQILQDAGDIAKALELLNQLIAESPDFVEAWNRRAVLYYTKADYKKSLRDCEVVLQLNPVHFGALHGLGLCYAALGEYRNAIYAFRRALAIQPYSLVNQKLILECTARLS